MLNEVLIERIIKRAIDNIALLTFIKRTKFEFNYISNWITEFRELDNSEFGDIIKLIFKQQSESIDKACDKNVDYIQIPSFGNLRLNKARHTILKRIHENNDKRISDEEIEQIIADYIETKKNNRKVTELDIKINLKGDGENLIE